jgi:hypothetical protein
MKHLPGQLLAYGQGFGQGCFMSPALRCMLAPTQSLYLISVGAYSVQRYRWNLLWMAQRLGETQVWAISEKILLFLWPGTGMPEAWTEGPPVHWPRKSNQR